MTRRTKLIIALGIPGALVILAGIVFLALPSIATRIALGTMKDMGLTPADLAVRRISLSGIRITGLTIGRETGLTADSIEVQYTTDGLRQGRVGTVNVTGASISIGMKDGTLDFGPLGPLIFGEGSGIIPFDHATVLDGKIKLSLPDGSFQVSFDCRLDRTAEEGIFDISLSCLPLAGTTLTASGSMRLEGGAITGTIECGLDELDLAQVSELAEIIPALGAYSIQGLFSMAGSVTFEDKTVLSQLILRLSGINLKQKEGDAGIEGLESEIMMLSLMPPVTAPAQRITIAKAFAGGLKTEDAEIIFSIENEDMIVVDSISAKWSGGVISAKKVRFQPSTMGIEADLIIDGIEVQKLMDTLYPGQIKCDGRLYGHLPIKFALSPKLKLSFGEGFLEARPPSGQISLNEEAAMTLLSLDEIIPLEQATTEQIPRLIAVQALRDLQYNRLECRFSNDADERWNAKIIIAGEGPRGDSAVPIQLSIDNKGLDEVLNLFVFSYNTFNFGAQQGMDKAEQLRQKEKEEDANQALDMFF